MRVVHLAAGAGGMYCGACARDVALVRGLTRRGHEVEVIPLYTPLRLDGTGELPTRPVMLGGINAWLDQYVPPWRYVPRPLRRWLDEPAVLQWATRFAVSTRASDLGPMIVSVLKGTDGMQRRTILELADYIVRVGRPDVVSITNSLLSGVAPELKRRLDVPIVCALQGEDAFVDQAREPFASQARQCLRENAGYVDLFISPGVTYADTMAAYLDVPRDSIRVVRTGLDVSPYRSTGRTRPYPFTVGYLSVITAAKGVDLLVDAVLGMLEAGSDVDLVIAGKVLDQKYWASVARRIEATPYASRIRFLGELDFRAKVHFLHTCSALAVPSRIAETRGVVALEAQAAGIPVVVPASGIFPEMMALTGGGLLYEPGDASSLAEALGALLSDPDRAEARGEAGARGVAEHFTAERMVDETLAVFVDAADTAFRRRSDD